MRNKSGVQPIEYKVLILPDSVEEKTVGGIILPDAQRDMERWAQTKGVIVALGASAFRDFHASERSTITAGVRVYYNKYQGQPIRGADGQDYILTTDKEISAVITEDAPAVLAGRKAA